MGQTGPRSGISEAAYSSTIQIWLLINETSADGLDAITFDGFYQVIVDKSIIIAVENEVCLIFCQRK